VVGGDVGIVARHRWIRRPAVVGSARAPHR
jgi:hypothetical protein